MYDIRLKRAYDTADPSDGTRILVERLWPRGIRKDDAALDHWFKDIAPSAELRKWYGHEPEKWPEFQVRYLAELKANTEELTRLRDICTGGTVSFIYAAKDEVRNSATVLRGYLVDGGRS